MIRNNGLFELVGRSTLILHEYQLPNKNTHIITSKHFCTNVESRNPAPPPQSSYWCTGTSQAHRYYYYYYYWIKCIYPLTTTTTKKKGKKYVKISKKSPHPRASFVRSFVQPIGGKRQIKFPVFEKPNRVMIGLNIIQNSRALFIMVTKRYFIFSWCSPDWIRRFLTWALLALWYFFCHDSSIDPWPWYIINKKTVLFHCFPPKCLFFIFPASLLLINILILGLYIASPWWEKWDKYIQIWF